MYLLLRKRTSMRREIAVSPLVHSALEQELGRDSVLEYLGRLHVGVSPHSGLQALMEAPPHTDPRRSVLDGMPLREAIAEAIDAVLTPLERWVFDAAVLERRAIRMIAADLSLTKSSVDRTKQRAVRKLRAALANNPLVVERLGGVALDQRMRA